MPKPAKPRSVEEVLALNLKHQRIDRGWTQLELAEHAGISRRQVERLEAADGNPTLQNLKRVAAAFGIEVSDLLKRGIIY